MRTNRERTNRELSRERGVVGLILLGLIVVAIAVASFFFVMRKQDEKHTDSWYNDIDDKLLTQS